MLKPTIREHLTVDGEFEAADHALQLEVGGDGRGEDLGARDRPVGAAVAVAQGITHFVIIYGL